ncbi:MAG: hypothetical protein A2Z14_08515 [Chloroflexi bacterium RBG_16_48_8]|nr:MAG: hypothetical protein A2Z14_08515 [Chloroflexi bacterium RBG_16_48_8]
MVRGMIEVQEYITTFRKPLIQLYGTYPWEGRNPSVHVIPSTGLVSTGGSTVGMRSKMEFTSSASVLKVKPERSVLKTTLTSVGVYGYPLCVYQIELHTRRFRKGWE